MAKKPTYKELEQRIKELEKRDLEHGRTEEALLDTEERYRLHFEKTSDRKQAEETLQQNEENFRALADNANDGILIAAGEGVHVYANKKASVITGYSISELLEMGIKELAHPDEFHKISMRYKRRVEGKHVPTPYETALIRKDGKTVEVEITGAKTLWHGQPGDIVILRDISRRKWAEKALRESEESFRRIVEDTPALICRFLPDGTLTLVNRRYCSYFNRKREDLVGQNFFQFIPEEDREEVRRHFMSLNQERSMITYEHRAIAPDGTIRWQQWTDRALINEEGRVKEYQSVGVDITQRKEAEEALRRARDELEFRVKERTRELDIKTTNLEEVNTALKVLLEKRDEDRAELEEKVLLNMKQLVEPFLEKLKKSGLNERQNAYLDILESNLNDIISPFSRRLSLTSSNLTPTELQVANLIKQGKTTKEVAEVLNLSTRTVDTHRLGIRTKLDIRNKKTNLRSHLISLE